MKCLPDTPVSARCRGWSDLPATWDRMPEAVRNPLANIFAALAPSSDQNRKLTALGRNGGGIVHPYFLSRMLFTPEQQNELLPGMKTKLGGLPACGQILDREPEPRPEPRPGQPCFLSRGALLYAQHTVAGLRFHEHGARTGGARAVDRPSTGATRPRSARIVEAEFGNAEAAAGQSARRSTSGARSSIGGKEVSLCRSSTGCGMRCVRR